MTDPTPHELADLLSHTALGDRAAFARLYARSSSALLGVILRIDRNRSTAEDVLQEVYVKVWRSAGSFDHRLSQPMTWLASIARNAAIDSIRRRQAQPQTVSTSVPNEGGDDDRDLLAEIAADEPGPAHLAEQAAEAQALKRCLGVLSGEQSQAVALAFYQGLSHAEVAEHLRQPLGTVKSWVRRGLMALKSCLERQPQEA
jgi:RNA polymerase sigma-70 factor (ECF subfamily)